MTNINTLFASTALVDDATKIARAAGTLIHRLAHRYVAGVSFRMEASQAFLKPLIDPLTGRTKNSKIFDCYF